MKRRDPLKNRVLPEDIIEELLLSTTPVAPPQERAKAMRAKILERAYASKPNAMLDFVTIRATEGVWINLNAKVEMKLLHGDGTSRSFLLRMQPGGSLPAHDHPSNEECMVLEGEVWLGDIVARTGDYHLAPKGIPHGMLTSPTGALLFLRTGHVGA